MANGNDFEERPKWQVYEAAVADLKEAHGDCEVTRDHRVTGRRSGQPRQVDIWLERKMGGHTVTVAIECKCHESRPVDIEIVEAFYAKLDDLGASKGVVVSATGFTEGAKRRADEKDIELETLTVEEALGFDWDAYTVTDVCQSGECWGTVTWKEWLSSDGGGQEPPKHLGGVCDYCASFHIQCGECSHVDAYDTYADEVECKGECGTRWALDTEKGDVVRFWGVEGDDEEDDDADGEDQD